MHRGGLKEEEGMHSGCLKEEGMHSGALKKKRECIVGASKNDQTHQSLTCRLASLQPTDFAKLTLHAFCKSEGRPQYR
jgi:hypothetical protein